MWVRYLVLGPGLAMEANIIFSSWTLLAFFLPNNTGKTKQQCCRKGDPFQGPKMGSCLTLEMRCLRRHICWQSNRLYWEGMPMLRAVGWGNPEELFCHMVHSLGLYGGGISFQVVFGQSFWLRVLPGGARIAQPRWTPARILGGGRTCGLSFWPFLNSSGRWSLIISMAF